MIRRSKAAALVAAATLVRGVTKVGPGIAGSYPAHHPAAKQARSFRRTVMAGGLAGLLAAGGMSNARAQQPVTPAQPASSPSGWTFNVAPYVWLASLNTTTNLNLPPAAGGGTASSTTSVGFGTLVDHINFGAMLAADAQYDRFSVLTDFMYLNLGGTASQFRSVNFPDHPHIPIVASAQTSQGMNMSAPIWTLAGGYTLLKGDWGNFDVIGGFRYLEINARINYSLGFTITGPRGGSQTFGGVGSVSGSVTLFNGIGGFRGRIRLGNSPLFIPYYFDAGAGDSKLTWQIATGLGYQTSWGDLSVTYRYLSFQQGSNNPVVQHLWVEGPMMMAAFRF
jgi:hypothetical protein